MFGAHAFASSYDVIHTLVTCAAVGVRFAVFGAGAIETKVCVTKFVGFDVT